MKIWIYRMITGILLAGWMTVIFLFSALPAAASGKISGTIAYRMVETADRMLHLELEETQMERFAEKIDHPLRKCAHMTEYAVMSWLCCFFLAGYLGFCRRSYWLSLGITAFYAATDEMHQLVVPGRSGQFGDVCIDTVGAALGLLALYLCRKLVMHLSKKK